ncbi:MAG: hypothetical protein CVT99_09250 [Bacteroidetes bacterium HGW-Bacteroidetes-16]|jgi:selenocysteine lyase/cysteine desulfurase|nr:MAG: hypothetical protein CVT99_09250 [Bacteroidetes bacterium HGW-Bacteroidetes-16]
METVKSTKKKILEATGSEQVVKGASGKNDQVDAYSALERAVQLALNTYANVHRGSGHNSMVSTHLYEKARVIVLEYLALNKKKYVVIFCTRKSQAVIKTQLAPGSYKSISSEDIGLSLGVWALAVNKKALPHGAPLFSGGGTTKLVSKDWVIWADVPEKFEAGTPAIINVIAFAKALSLIQQKGKDIFLNPHTDKLPAAEILYQDQLESYSGKELLHELRQTLIGHDVLVPTMEGARPFINLDNSASTPTFTPVWNAFRQTWCQSTHVKQEIIQEVKSICANMLGAPLSDYEVIFTSNTTEAINLVAESLGHDSKVDIEPVVLNTLLEHSSNDLPWRMVPGHSLIRLSVDSEGFLDLNELETMLSDYNQKGLHGKKRIRLVAVSGASNVLGICNNLEETGRIVHQFGAQLLVDAAQLIAHRKVDMEKCGIDYLVFSAHKVYAPFGTGALVAGKGLLHFSTEELELIQLSGEENAGGIAALGKALVLLQRIGMDLIREEEQALTRKALRGMEQITGLEIYGTKNPDSPGFNHKVGVIVFNIKNKMPNHVAKQLALRGGIGVRYGCHCAHIMVKHILHITPFLEQFQRLIQTLFPKFRFLGVIRVSLGIENTEEDVDTLIQVLEQITEKPRKSTDQLVETASKGTPILSLKEVQQQVNNFINEVALKVYSSS